MPFGKLVLILGDDNSRILKTVDELVLRGFQPVAFPELEISNAGFIPMPESRHQERATALVERVQNGQNLAIATHSQVIVSSIQLAILQTKLSPLQVELRYPDNEETAVFDWLAKPSKYPPVSSSRISLIENQLHLATLEARYRERDQEMMAVWNNDAIAISEGLDLNRCKYCEKNTTFGEACEEPACQQRHEERKLYRS